ncbi:MAG: phytoene/squalene synthase family protein [Solirubrobacteraceae bacterium]
MTAPALEVERSYRACEEITRRAAANFYYGIRLLPREKREAMSAVYAFARRVDDIGDEQGERSAKLSALALERERLRGIAGGDGAPGDPVGVALAHAAVRFKLPLEALELLIDAVEQDVRETQYESFEQLVLYCRGVAGSIGRLCVAIFCGGHVDGHDQLADDLGVAMQLTNVLRDVREDFQNGRVYLPAEDLRRFGCASVTELNPELIRFEAMRAREWFDRGMGLVDLLDGRSASCVLAMTGIYRRILQRILSEPDEIMRRRISLSVPEKAWIAARSLAGARA